MHRRIAGAAIAIASAATASVARFRTGHAVRQRDNEQQDWTRRRTMKAIVVTDQAAGTAGMTLVERPEPQAAINDVVVQVHASGFVPTELTWPSTWTNRLGRDRT